MLGCGGGGFGELRDVHRDAVGDRLPAALLDERHERDRDIGQHEQREGEHVEHLLARGGADRVPLDERRQDAEHEHEDHVVHQAEADGADRGGDHDAGGHEARRRHGDDDRVEQDRHDGEQHARRDGHQHIVAGEAMALGVGEDAGW